MSTERTVISRGKIQLLLRGCLHDKTCSSGRFIPGWLLDFMMRLHVWMFFPCLMDMTMPSWIDENYACATHSSPQADGFHTETIFFIGRYHCKISYRSEIRTPVQQPRWTHAGVTRASVTSCGDIMKQIQREPEWTCTARKFPWCHVNTPYQISSSFVSTYKV